MKRILACLLALSLSIPVAAGEFPAEAVSKAAWSVVTLMSPDQEIYCSGFVIDTERGYVLTADHCVGAAVDYGDPLIVDGEPAEEVCHDLDRDLSLLQTKTEKPALIPSFMDISAGLPVAGLGFAAGGPLKAVLGSVRDVAFVSPYSPIKGDTWLRTGIGEPGMSGGPIIDEAGGVVGMVQFFVPNGIGEVSEEDSDYGNSVQDLIEFVVQCEVYEVH